MKPNRFLLISLWLLFAGLFSGCIADHRDIRTMNENGEITLLLKAPAMDVNSDLRQMTVEQESAVSKVSILVFKTKGADGSVLEEMQETFSYIAPISGITKNSAGYYEVRAKLRVTDTTTPYRLVLIANHDVNSGELSEGMTKAEIFALGSMQQVFAQKWDNGTSATIPMWGESNAAIVANGVKFGDCKDAKSKDKIHLIRSLARVDVGLNFEADVKSETATPTAQTPFKMQSVRVYRMADKFSIPGNQAKTLRTTADGQKDPLPVLPDPVPANAADANPLIYENVASESATVREIYIPERLKGDSKDNRPCLVVGGIYDKDTKPTYYRLDFIKTPTVASPRDTAEALDILRNHRYRFNIVKVTGPGYETPEEALVGEPINIAFDVVVWDEAEIGEIAYDGQYYLAVDKKAFEFGRDKSSQALTIRTNWPQGYKIVDENGTEYPRSEASLGDKWIWFQKQEGETFKVDVDQHENLWVTKNETGADREIPSGKLFVQAGRIKWPLTVKQLNKIVLDVKVFEYKDGKYDPAKPINEWNFKAGEQYTFRVDYTPGSKLSQIPMDAATEVFNWTQVDINPEQGYALYTCQVSENAYLENNFSAIGVFRFGVTQSEEQAYTDFYCKYMKYDAIPYRDKELYHNMLKKEEMYVLGNFEQGFFVQASAPYKLTIKDIQIVSGTQTDITKVVKTWNKEINIGEGFTSGILELNPHRFQTYDYIKGTDAEVAGKSITQATVTLELASTDPEMKFETKTFKIHFLSAIPQPTANSYIVQEGQTLPILIPVSEQINKAYDYYEQFSTEFESIAKWRDDLGIGTTNGVPSAQYNQYISEGGHKLNRLEPTDPDWFPEVLWSTLSGSSSDNGFEKVERQILEIGQKNYILLKVKPTVKSGTALVSAIKRKKGTNFSTRGQKDYISLWNWMIWVVPKENDKTDQNCGWPWDEKIESNGRKRSTWPYMNRNLGADRYTSHTNFAENGNVNLDFTGLYYHFGIPVPYHPYNETNLNNSGVGTQNASYMVKYRNIWYNPTYTDGELVTLPEMKSATAGKAFWALRVILENPTWSPFRQDLNEDCVFEWGGFSGSDTQGRPIVPFIWDRAGTSTFNSWRVRDALQYKTKKTPFDPCPYGWKVPSVGSEIMPLGTTHEHSTSYTGMILDGHPDRLTYREPTSKAAALLVSTPYNNVAYFPFFGRGNWGDYATWRATIGATADKEWQEGQNYQRPNNQAPIRPIFNEEEADFKLYTEEGLMNSMRSKDL